VSDVVIARKSFSRATFNNIDHPDYSNTRYCCSLILHALLRQYGESELRFDEILDMIDVDLGDIQNIHDNIDDIHHSIDGMHNFMGAPHHMMDRNFLDYQSMSTAEFPQPTPHDDGSHGTESIVHPVEPSIKSEHVVMLQHVIKSEPTTQVEQLPQVDQFNQVEPTMQLQSPPNPKSPKSSELVWVDGWVPRVEKKRAPTPASQKNQPDNGE